MPGARLLTRWRTSTPITPNREPPLPRRRPPPRTPLFSRRMLMTPTPKQLKILTSIRNFRVRNGYSPTMQELADQLGVSKVTIFEHVEALEKKQLILRTHNRARSLEVSPTV